MPKIYKECKEVYVLFFIFHINTLKLSIYQILYLFIFWNIYQILYCQIDNFKMELLRLNWKKKKKKKGKTKPTYSKESDQGWYMCLLGPTNRVHRTLSH